MTKSHRPLIATRAQHSFPKPKLKTIDQKYPAAVSAQALQNRLAAVDDEGQVFFTFENGKTRYFFTNKAADDYEQQFPDRPRVLDYFTGLYADLEDES